MTKMMTMKPKTEKVKTKMKFELGNFALMLLAGLTLVGCDDVSRRLFDEDRADSDYRAAMEDYRAGRIDAAVKGFAKVLQKSPGNASARFQYACLLQDGKKDFPGAFCAYREFLAQRPDSEKARIAMDRLETCEKEVAAILASKYHLNDVEGVQNILSETQKAKSELEKRYAQLEKDVEMLRRRINSLSGERDRLVAAIKTDADAPQDSPIAAVAEVKIAKDLLEEEEPDDRVGAEDDVAKLKLEEKDESEEGSSILPARKPEDLARRKQLEAEAERRRKEAEELAKANAHPPTYVVQEGDTLYKIAVKFYRRTSAWKLIRDANKAVISSDGRVKAGDIIKLP